MDSYLLNLVTVECRAKKPFAADCISSIAIQLSDESLVLPSLVSIISLSESTSICLRAK